MNDRPIYPTDLVNWYVYEDGKQIKCFGKVLKPSNSPVVEVLCIYRGDKKIIKKNTVDIPSLTVCK